jgi:hypothetical protein
VRVEMITLFFIGMTNNMTSHGIGMDLDVLHYTR